MIVSFPIFRRRLHNETIVFNKIKTLTPLTVNKCIFIKKSINVAKKYLILNGLKERRHVMLQFLFMANIETVANPTDERDCKRDFNRLSVQG